MRDKLRVDTGESVEVQLSPEMQELLDSLPDTNTARQVVQFTPQEDDLIVLAYPRKSKEALAKAVGTNRVSGEKGCCPQVLRKHYIELCEKRGIEPETRSKNHDR